MDVNNKNPLIVDIKENSLDDGPGIRTVVFFKGCPLNCIWCQNPEAQDSSYELGFQPQQCIHCEPNCTVQCPSNAFNYPEFAIYRDKCVLSFNCVVSCPADVFSKVGKYFSINELVDKCLSNKVFYDNSNGGCTLSGGEPFLFPEYVLSFVKKLKNVTIRTTIETCGLFNLSDIVLEIISNISLLYYDIKLYDPIQHQTYCGVSNSKIFENFRTLIHNGYVILPQSKNDIKPDSNVPYIIPRIPLIPDITTTEHNLQNIRDLFQKLNIKLIDLLPYNPLWLNKSSALGLIHKYTRDSWMTRQELTYVHSYFRDFEFDTFKI